jgi:hypothetical protein
MQMQQVQMQQTRSGSGLCGRVVRLGAAALGLFTGLKLLRCVSS